MSCHPEIKWAQREDKIYLTVELCGTKDAKVNLAPEGVLSFSATAGQHVYNLKLDLADKVNVHEIKINIGGRSMFCVLNKVVPKWWNKLLTGDVKTPPYVKVDWDKWVDEDDDKWVDDEDEDKWVDDEDEDKPVIDAFRKFAQQMGYTKILDD